MERLGADVPHSFDGRARGVDGRARGARHRRDGGGGGGTGDVETDGEATWPVGLTSVQARKIQRACERMRRRVRADASGMGVGGQAGGVDGRWGPHSGGSYTGSRLRDVELFEELAASTHAQEGSR